MAELRATVVNGDLEVTGNIIPWGGERTAYAYIGSSYYSCNFGLLDDGQSSGDVTFTPNIPSDTDMFNINVIGANYGAITDISKNQDAKTFKATAINHSGMSHTIIARVYIDCYRKL